MNIYGQKRLQNYRIIYLFQYYSSFMSKNMIDSCHMKKRKNNEISILLETFSLI